ALLETARARSPDGRSAAVVVARGDAHRDRFEGPVIERIAGRRPGEARQRPLAPGYGPGAQAPDGEAPSSQRDLARGAAPTPGGALWVRQPLRPAQPAAILLHQRLQHWSAGVEAE